MTDDLEKKTEECYKELIEWVTMAELDTEGKTFCTPATLHRYAVARNGDFDAAVKNIESTLEWRKIHVPPELHCPACDDDTKMHCFFPLGLDSKNRVVIYACAAKAQTNETDVTVRHMCQTLEHAWRYTEKLNLHHQWLWLVDFGGFGIKHALQGRTSNASLGAFGTHMPERLGTVLLINPPSIFDLLLAAIKPFLDKRTMSKVNIVHGTSATIGDLLEPHGIPKNSGISKWMKKVLDMEPVPGSNPSLASLDQDILHDIYLPRKINGVMVPYQKQEPIPEDEDVSNTSSSSSSSSSSKGWFW